MLINFLSETNTMIESCGYSESDVKFFQIENYNPDNDNYEPVQFSYNFFKEFNNFEYDNKYGCYIPKSMKIVFEDNCWLERTIRDGHECWEYKKA